MPEAGIVGSSGLKFMPRAQVERAIAAKSRKLNGFARKAMPTLPSLSRPAMYIFNLSDKEFKWHQAGFGFYVVPACKPNQEISEPCVIMETTPHEYLKIDASEFEFYDAGEMAMAIMNIGPGILPSADLRQYGVFVSEHNPPLPGEVAEARARLDGTWNRLLAEGDRIYAEGQTKGINGQMIEDDMKWAARKTGQTQNREWVKGVKKMVDCPYCQNPVSVEAIVHFGQNGCGGVLPFEGSIEKGWDRAIMAGLKKETDRPVEPPKRKAT